jgi:hypothetical protein
LQQLASAAWKEAEIMAAKLLKFDIRPAIESLGWEEFFKQVGVDRVIEEVGVARVMEHVGVARVIERVGLDRVIQELNAMDLLKRIIPHLSPAKRKELKALL